MTDDQPARGSEVHAALAGREPEMHQLTEAVRRLVDLTVNNLAPLDELRAVVATLEGAADRLAQHAPNPPMSRHAHANPTDGAAPRRPPTNPDELFRFDMVLGPYNPLAVPIRYRWEPPIAIGEVTFDTAYEGPPGCVHGAVIAASFDQVYNVANIASGTAGPTSWLAMRYRKPTPLRQPLRFECWIDRVEDRRIHTKGRLLHGETVTVESEGIFVMLDPDRIQNLIPRSMSSGPRSAPESAQ